MNRSMLVDAFRPQRMEIWRRTGMAIDVTLAIPREHFKEIVYELSTYHDVRLTPIPTILEIAPHIFIEPDR